MIDLDKQYREKGYTKSTESLPEDDKEVWLSIMGRRPRKARCYDGTFLYSMDYYTTFCGIGDRVWWKYVKRSSAEA